MEKGQKKKKKRIINLDRKRLGAKLILNLARYHKLSPFSQHHELTKSSHFSLWVAKTFAPIQWLTSAMKLITNFRGDDVICHSPTLSKFSHVARPSDKFDELHVLNFNYAYLELKERLSL
jgi:hypothetical protein